MSRTLQGRANELPGVRAPRRLLGDARLLADGAHRADVLPEDRPDPRGAAEDGDGRGGDAPDDDAI